MSVISGQEVRLEARGGLMNVRAFTFLILWYFFSLCTLFMNKYILSYREGDATILGNCQMLMTTALGCLQMYFPCGMYTPVKRKGKPAKFWRNMLLVGSTRFMTVLLGLIALNYVAVSFTETVKSSAPIFTVVISWLVLGEKTSAVVVWSTVPIMAGLALCSATELSFELSGFLAAVAANLTECFQNVYSKMLISGDSHKYTPAELQFYTSLASLLIQIPTSAFLIHWDHIGSSLDEFLVLTYLLNGAFFHFQSITAYVLMDYISPVTHSVANTVKRALLIWLSILVFHNPVTFLSGLGTVIVFVGVVLYNRARAVPTDEEGCNLREHYKRLRSALSKRSRDTFKRINSKLDKSQSAERIV
ncbi:unnamed protein product [Notodromas monacha]|uniref:Sugar phosphate transporter domain-containing protein n=1 Tax=Notodromas monacha TaxID=399045 RepID=A0A7R9G9G4_9CRUS|nr:unnamed protein product [Notodromas monacha]CAG0914182.1 unnamed protein product [Notodromas monacha]